MGRKQFPETSAENSPRAQTKHVYDENRKMLLSFDAVEFPSSLNERKDLQSYLSHLSLFLAPESKKFYILVDNRPWLKDLVSRPAHLWQLMVTKSRLSPFANTRGRRERKETGGLYEVKASSKPNTSKSKKFKRWFSLIDAATLSKKRALLPVKKLRNSLISNSKLHRTLYGFIVFEVAWDDVRGVNYLNELQTDTSLAIEAKFMRRWEFDSIAQAVRCISSWFPGTFNELLLLKGHLDSAIGEVFYDAQENFPKTSFTENTGNIFHDSMCAGDESPCCSTSNFRVYPATREDSTSLRHTSPPPDGPYKRRKVSKSINIGVEEDTYSEETHSETVGSPILSQSSYASDCEETVEATQYRDVLLLFRFNDRDLPFKLKEIIMSDLRLLTLLESGLPSWVLFLQSYPGFCHVYRPWMCPLARALYVIISFVTVLIGFYDLYKNVPVLKATASRLCGPLFDWIETWEMISRIKYLGTMLFLHNFQKALKWFLMITRTTRSFFSILAQPMVEPLVGFLEVLLPFWNMSIEVVRSLCSAVSVAIDSSCNLVEDLVEIVLLPLWFILSVTWSTVMSLIYPVFWILWEVLYAPIRLVLGLSSLIAFICTCLYDMVGDMWLFVSSIVKFASDTEATVSTHDVSMWSSLWNDLFSQVVALIKQNFRGYVEHSYADQKFLFFQVFRAVRSIFNGFVAFFTACNRHRLRSDSAFSLHFYVFLLLICNFMENL
ncbi:hypothetical protein RJ639_045690 [Escallonia herrerae]|uniref:Uncharacterized protein n=1 Tax=Escallonia herrerae TaxID=1293975 RepID=A0AA88W6I2_9ASTE|nr:hypothetical protein RJ639_045690 [Escallonia herrerae]